MAVLLRPRWIYPTAGLATVIQRSAADFEVRHASLLEVPVNYYDDLSARWGLEDATLTMLRRHGLLYDRDETGEFWHLYTKAFHDRFFFEAVQRRAGYTGFGATNAAVRSAAPGAPPPCCT